MTWNWEQAGWPAFVFDMKALEPFERQFLLRSGEFIGAFRHIGTADRAALRIELMSDEAVKTSAIEGEILNRDSVQSSLRHQFGLGPEPPGMPAAERGIAQMMLDLYEHFAAPLNDAVLHGWNQMLLAGGRSIPLVGAYRTHADAMQVVSGPVHRRTVHFEAPPSEAVPAEMRRFIGWFNDAAPQGTAPLPPLTRAGLAHLYIVCIHPYEDGNGRIARALAEKSLAQSLGHPSLIALAYTIERTRKDYYAALERNNKDMQVTDWLTYFATLVLEAQANTLRRVDFFIAKARFYERLRGQFNERQAKVVARLFREGIDGFKGGLSAENYITITGTSRATATRDLHGLVEKGALTRTGELRHTRYALKLDLD
jgi:Fic family protein